MTYETLLYETDGAVVTMTFNRPDVHNCMSELFIRELTDAVNAAQAADGARLVVLQAKGRSYSAGADLNDMKKMVDFTKEQNMADSTQLSGLMETLRHCRIPTLAVVQGPAFGGGCGLVACCDIAIATPAVTFCFTEVKLGLIPAVISPYIHAKIGASQMRRYFITAETIDAQEAQRIGLVHCVVQPDDLRAEADRIRGLILNNGPEALKAVKALMDMVAADPDSEATRRYTIEAIANIRVSGEGQEGLAAFFEKRPAAWRSD